MRIAILSRSSRIYSTRRLHEAAFSRGHIVEVIDHVKCTVLIEKGRPRVHFEGRTLAGIDAIIPRIGSSVTFYGSSTFGYYFCSAFSLASSVSFCWLLDSY